MHRILRGVAVVGPVVRNLLGLEPFDRNLRGVEVVEPVVHNRLAVVLVGNFGGQGVGALRGHRLRRKERTWISML